MGIISVALWKQKPVQAVLSLRGFTQAEGSELFPFYPGVCRAPSLTLFPALTPKSQEGYQQTGKRPTPKVVSRRIRIFQEEHY